MKSADLIGLKVTHNRIPQFGVGTVVNSDSRFVWIVFENDEEQKERKYYLTALGGTFLKYVDDETYNIEEYVKTVRINEQYQTLINELKKYGFEGFVHYTDYENLKSIFESGYIMSRREMEMRGEKWTDVADHSVLQHTPEAVKEKVRLLYGFNTPISYWFEKYAIENGSEMVAIVIDPSIVKQYNCSFFEKTAVVSEEGVALSDTKTIKQFNWKEIFERGSHTLEDSSRKTKYRDAEVLVDERIPTEFISKVYFRSRSFLSRAEMEIGPREEFCLGKIQEKKHFTPGVQ